MAEKKTFKSEISMAAEGEFLREYGKQYFVVASEALGIGRVKWQMVPIGKNGKDGIVFYLTTEQMLALCKEIENGTFAKKIAADANNSYPSAYKYATGTYASLNLNIGSGKVGCRIQMRDQKAKLQYIMAVSMESLQTMARKYLLATGMIPVAPGSYYESIIKTFEEGRVKRANFIQKEADKVGETVDMNAVSEDAEPMEEKSEKPKTKEKAENTDKTEKASDKSAGVKDMFAIHVTGEKKVNKGFYQFTGVDKHNNPVKLLFKKDDADKLTWFATFENLATTNGTDITFWGEKNGDFVLYIANKKK